MVLYIGLAALAVAGGLLYSAHRAGGHPDFRRMSGGYLGFVGTLLTVGGLSGYGFSYHYVFEIIFGLTMLVVAFMLMYHAKYSRAEAAGRAAAALDRAPPVNDDRPRRANAA